MNDGYQQQPLAAIMTATTEVMKAELARIRASFDHSGLVGSSVEEIVVQFLNERLPTSMRAAAGQAVDSTGERSKQLDVIVYDTARTPLLFTSPGETQNLVPVEGIIAVIEVKTKLTLDELRRSSQNCASVKQLQRTAFLPQLLSRSVNLYGSVWNVPPIHYSVFAFESDGLYAEALNDTIGQDLPLYEQIDIIVCLDRGLCLNGSIDIESNNGKVTASPSFWATPGPDTIRLNVDTANALVVWYAVLTDTLLNRVPGPGIDVTRYLASELQISGRVGAGAAGKAYHGRILEKFANAIELDPSIARKIVRGESLTPRELYDLMRNPAHTFYDKGDDQSVSDVLPLIAVMKQTAREEGLHDWLARWFPNHDANRAIDS